ncbi:hypothetical protein QVD17_08025 [Tagetes erecta]|uniref:Uncharacterized protein n=1 Tax=Tagetes erecta TaxID=13708 RepID=A0AAD8NXD4_TARER|nr:hypothetical protein QVD17_08025 [Tagetes erecta]
MTLNHMVDTLEEMVALYFDEERNEIYTGHGTFHNHGGEIFKPPPRPRMPNDLSSSPSQINFFQISSFILACTSNTHNVTDRYIQFISSIVNFIDQFIDPSLFISQGVLNFIKEIRGLST